MTDEKPGPGEEHVVLNADELEVEELDDETLSTAAGGCWDAYCGVYKDENETFEEQSGS